MAVVATTIFLLIICFYENISVMLNAMDTSSLFPIEHTVTTSLNKQPVVATALGAAHTSFPIEHDNSTTFKSDAIATTTTSLSAPNAARASPQQQRCFKVVTNTGGWGNRIGPLMCALGVASSYSSYSSNNSNNSNNMNLTVLWNAANEGTAGDRIPRTVKTGRGGYSIQDIQALVSFPFSFADKNVVNDESSPSNNNTSTQREVTFYSESMQADVQSWKHYFNRVQHRVVLDYEAHEQWFEDLDCFNIPLGHPIPDGNAINDFTPEPCWTRYKAFANTPEFSYLKNIIPKDEFVDHLIEGTRRIVPKIDFCLPQTGYLVIHARRGDRSSPGTTSDIMSHIATLRGVISLAIVSENETVKEDLIRQALNANFTVVAPWCTAQNLTQPQQALAATTAKKRRIRYHLPTVSMLQDYFLMASSCGVITDYERDQSSFSTTAALGNGRPMLYPGRSRHHVVQQFFAKHGNEGKTMRNVYFLDTIGQFAERVKEEAIQRGYNTTA